MKINSQINSKKKEYDLIVEKKLNKNLRNLKKNHLKQILNLKMVLEKHDLMPLKKVKQMMFIKF